jgi:beta-glucanase (GH16 family)
MNLSRRTLRAVAAVALASAPLLLTAAALPAPASAARLTAPATVLHRHVASAGRYDVHVTITTRFAGRTGARGNVIDVRIGTLSRRVTTGSRGRARLSASVLVREGTLTIRVHAKRDRMGLTVTMSRVRRRPAPTGKTTASSGSSGSTGPTGSTGSTGSTAPTVPSVAVGSLAITLPAGFAPVATYTNLVKDYEFTGSSLPADWTAANDTTHGFAGTIFNSSQVAMTGSTVALSVSNQPADGYAYQSGWISTEGSYAFDYGMIDFRAEMPAGQGLWSGLWLDQPDNSNPWGEIDVQEMLLADTHTVYGSLHGWAPSDWGETQSTQMSADASAGYHDYQLIWQPGLLTWALDGVAYAQYDQAQAQAAGYPWVMDDGAGYYIIADLAAGSSVWGGPPNSTTPFPSSLQLQSVKIWQ